jgi:hypothetical protein
MPIDDGYDLLPHDEIRRLKQEVDSLKRTGGPAQGNDGLIDSMENMTHSINSLLKIFKEAAEDMKLDEHDSVLLSDKIDPLLIKIDRVLEQNEKIAKGIVAIADMIEDLKNSQGAEPARQTFQRRASYGPMQQDDTPMPPSPEPSSYSSSGYPEPSIPPMPKPLPQPGMSAPQMGGQVSEADKKKFFNIQFK